MTKLSFSFLKQYSNTIIAMLLSLSMIYATRYTRRYLWEIDSVYVILHNFIVLACIIVLIYSCYIIIMHKKENGYSMICIVIILLLYAIIGWQLKQYTISHTLMSHIINGSVIYDYKLALINNTSAIIYKK